MSLVSPASAICGVEALRPKRPQMRDTAEGAGAGTGADGVAVDGKNELDVPGSAEALES